VFNRAFSSIGSFDYGFEFRARGGAGCGARRWARAAASSLFQHRCSLRRSRSIARPHNRIDLTVADLVTRNDASGYRVAKLSDKLGGTGVAMGPMAKKVRLGVVRITWEKNIEGRVGREFAPPAGMADPGIDVRLEATL